MIAFGQSIAHARARAIAEINGAIGEERTRHITVAPGQDMLYSAKEAEALRYIARATEGLTPGVTGPRVLPLDDFPLIAGEIGPTAPDAWQVAQLIANMAMVWRRIASGLEADRLGAIHAVEIAASVAAVDAALAAFRARPKR